MSGMGLQNSVRSRRTAAGLSQTELASQCGVTRQALAAIERGRQVPSTAVALGLARALHCRVEDLFSLATPPSMSVPLVAPSGCRVVLGRVDGTWRAHPLSFDAAPADGRVTAPGGPGSVMVEPLRDLGDCERNVLVAGCAPLLGLLAGCLHGRVPARASWIRADSARALDLLADGAVHIAGVHLADASSRHGHRALVRKRFAGRQMAIVGLSLWRQGIAVAHGNPLSIRSVHDTQREHVRLVGRAEGSGAHELLARMLSQAGLARQASGAQLIASGHDEVARLVGMGLADAGIVFEGSAIHEGLDFIPLAEERFDLVVPRDRLDATPVAQLLEFLDHREFRAQAACLPGYDLSIAGQLDAAA